MGYNTTFEGKITVNVPLQPVHLQYIKKFFQIRHVSMSAACLRRAIETGKLPPNLLPFKPTEVGDEGQWYVGSDITRLPWYAGSEMSQGPRGYDLFYNYNVPPRGCPSLWCDWDIEDDNMTLRLRDGKHYGHFEWPQYLIESFFKPWGYVLNGKVKFRGENLGDMGLIHINDNVVMTTYAWTKVR